MNLNDVSTQLLYTTVLIYSKKSDNSIVSGTGFIFSIQESETSSIPLLITNYHVLEDATVGSFELHCSENGNPVADKSITVQFDKTIINNNKLGNLDLIAIPLAASLNNLHEKGIHVFYRSIDQNMIPSDEQIKDLAALEDVTFIGYPNGLYDKKNKIPIIRRGITATPIWNNFEGEENFLIDAGVFPGSSGSPVFIYNNGTYPTKDGITVGSRLLFVGIISGTLRNNASEKNYLDLGIAINSIAMYREINLFIKKVKGLS